VDAEEVLGQPLDRREERGGDGGEAREEERRAPEWPGPAADARARRPDDVDAAEDGEDED